MSAIIITPGHLGDIIWPLNEGYGPLVLLGRVIRHPGRPKMALGGDFWRGAINQPGRGDLWGPEGDPTAGFFRKPRWNRVAEEGSPGKVGEAGKCP